MTNRLVIGINSPFSAAHTTAPASDAPAEDVISPAVQWAVHYASPRHLDLELVHVLEETRAFVPAGLREEIILSAEQQLRAHADHIVENHPILRVHSKVVEGSPVEKLSEQATGAELLVIGTHALRRFSNLVFSTRAAQIVSRSAVSVVIIPAEPRPQGAGIVVGVDGSPASIAAVEFAAQEADRLGEPLTVVYAWRVPAPWSIATIEVDWPLGPEEADRILLAESVAGLPEKYPDLRVTEDMNAMLPVDALIASAANARMLVVGTHGRRGFARFWLGSVSHQLILAMPCPLAVIRSQVTEF
jgi:nucleotide-binding universal stress UspA family protein